MELMVCQARGCFCVVNGSDVLCDGCLSRLIDVFGRDAVDEYMEWRANPQPPFSARHAQWMRFLSALQKAEAR